MTIATYASRQTKRMAESLAGFIASTAAEKLQWRPSVPGGAATRSVLDQISKCVAVNRFIAGVLRAEQTAPPSGNRSDGEFSNCAAARNQLLRSAEAVAAAIGSLDEAALPGHI